MLLMNLINVQLRFILQHQNLNYLQNVWSHENKLKE